MQIRNPRTGEKDYTLRVESEQTVHQFSEKLRENQRHWQKQGLQYRISVLQKWLIQLKEGKRELVEKLSIDTARRKIAMIEVDSILGLIQGWCYRAPLLMEQGDERPSTTSPDVQVRQQWVPYALVGVISPWNFPLLLALIDTIPALLAGSSVLLKPSEVTPRFMDPLETSIKAVPALAKVLKLVRGGAETGKAVVQSADAVCFTGSVPTGKAIAMVCAQRFIPVFLELGGKDPAIVLEDADLELSTDAILRSCVGATGQACQSLERIYVAETIHDAFVEKMAVKAKAVTLTTKPSSGQLGPLIFARQAKKIQAQIDDALAKGAQLHTGGKIENIEGGLWCRPTLLTKVNHQMDIMTEETFGPVIPVMPFRTEKEAIALANDSQYGLSASVFSKNRLHAIAIAQQIEAGAISINDGSLTNKVFDAEKHAFKLSGINGSRMGDAGFLRFFRKKALLIQTGTPGKMEDFEEAK